MYAAISATSGSAVESTALFSWSFSSEDVLTSRGSHSTVFALVFSLVGLGAVAVVLFRRFKPPATQLPATNTERTFAAMPVLRIDYEDLKTATQGFSNTQLVGKGGFSSVYKGTLPKGFNDALPEGAVVAVKKLKARENEGLKIEADFASEIRIFSQLRHRNLLQLKGWGYKKGEAVLVYDYLPNGSLSSYLFGKEKLGKKWMLDEKTRFDILMGVAAGLEYLHEGLEQCVLHRDVKAANVLLTDRFEAVLCDFGLARLITHDEVVTLTKAGTTGYMAPEVVFTGKVTAKADVYSFGILALEVACGRRAIGDVRPPDESGDLLEWVWQLQENGKLMDALDPVCRAPATIDLEEQYHSYIDYNAEQTIAERSLIAHTPESDDQEHQAHSWQGVLHVALHCCFPRYEDRPTMREVRQTLLKGLVLALPFTRPRYSEPFSIFVSLLEASASTSRAPAQSSSLSAR